MIKECREERAMNSNEISRPIETALLEEVVQHMDDVLRLGEGLRRIRLGGSSGEPSSRDREITNQIDT